MGSVMPNRFGMKRSVVPLLALLIVAGTATAGRVIHVERAATRDRSHAEGAPTLRPFPDVIGSGGLRPMLPNSGRSYTDLLKGAAPAGPDTIRIAIFRVEYENDTAGDATTGEGRFILEDDGSWFVDAPPHDSTYFHTHMEVLRRYYLAQSYGRLYIEWEIFPKSKNAGEYRLADTQDYLPGGDPAGWDLEVRIDGLIRLCTDALTLVDTVDGGVDFSAYEGYMIIHAGPDLQTDINGDSPGDTPSFFLAYGDEDTVRVDRDTDNPVLITGVTMIPEHTTQDGFVFGLNGVLAHEFGHQLGLPDLYNTFYSWPSVGVWGLMDSGGMVSIDAGDVFLGSVIPASLSAWSKLYLGWVEPVIVTSTRDLSIACATDLDPPEGADRYAVIPVNEQEYFILENRCGLAEEGGFAAKLDTVNSVLLGPVTNDDDEEFTFDYDYALPGWGILAWHINNRHLTPERIIYANDVNVDYNDRAIEVEEADGIKDLGNPYSAYWDGSPYDPFFEGNAVRFGPETAPNTDLSDGGRSRVTVHSIGPPGRVIDLRVEVDRNLAGFPLSVTGDSTAAIPLGLALVGTETTGIAAIWSVPDTAGARYGVTTALLEEERWQVRRADLPGEPAGPPVVRGAEAYVAASDTLFLVDPAGGDPLVPLALLTGDSLSAEPLLLDVDGDGVDEFLIAEGESLSIYGIDGMSVTLLGRNFLAEPPASNLAADPDGPVIYYVSVFGYLNALDYGPAGKSGRAVHRRAPTPAKRAGEDRPVTLLLADMDRDDEREIVLVTTDGTVWVLDQDGVPNEGWPVSIGAETTGDPFLSDRNGDGILEIALPSGPELLILEGNGILSTDTPYSIPPYLRREGATTRLSGNGIAVRSAGGDETVPVAGDDGGRLWRWSGREEIAEGWPVSTGSENGVVVGGPMPGGGASSAAAYALSSDGFLYAYALDGVDGDRFLWSGPGGDGTNRYVADEKALTDPSPAGDGPGRIEAAYCYPNPARGEQVAFRYALTADEDVSIRVYHPAGGRVTEVDDAPGRRGENEVWIDTAGLGSGVYTLRFEAGSDVRFVKLAVVR